jgi:hypothetical protein
MMLAWRPRYRCENRDLLGGDTFFSNQIRWCDLPAEGSLVPPEGITILYYLRDSESPDPARDRCINHSSFSSP